MSTRSTLTAADYRTRAEDFLGLESDDNDLEDTTIKIAIDEYMQFYRSLEVLGFKEYGREKASVTLSHETTGTDLSTEITDAYDYVTDFKVYNASVASYNRILPVKEQGNMVGYTLRGSTLYLLGFNSDVSAIILYQKEAERVTMSAELSAITPDIDERFERALLLWIKFKYFIRSGDNDDAAFEARDDSRSLTMEGFSLKRRITGI